jgi:hypothetical protein
MSIPAASGLITGSTALFDFDACLRLRAIALSLLRWRRPEPRKTGTLLNGIAANRHRLPNVTTALSTRLGIRLATGLGSSIARPTFTAAAIASAMMGMSDSLLVTALQG